MRTSQIKRYIGWGLVGSQIHSFHASSWRNQNVSPSQHIDVFTNQKPLKPQARVCNLVSLKSHDYLNCWPSGWTKSPVPFLCSLFQSNIMWRRAPALLITWCSFWHDLPLSCDISLVWNQVWPRDPSWLIKALLSLRKFQVFRSFSPEARTKAR